jgi:hypothetical protein
MRAICPKDGDERGVWMYLLRVGDENVLSFDCFAASVVHGVSSKSKYI